MAAMAVIMSLAPTFILMPWASSTTCPIGVFVPIIGQHFNSIELICISAHFGDGEKKMAAMTLIMSNPGGSNSEVHHM